MLVWRRCVVGSGMQVIDKSPAISHDAVSTVGSGEGKGDDLCRDGEESI